MKTWSSNWKASTKTKKQRKYAAKAPLHIKAKFLAAHLSKELRQKHKMRSIRLRRGDRVKVVRGNFKGRTGKIESVDVKNTTVYITGIEFVKKEGSKSLYPIKPSKLVIQELELGDKRRMGVEK